MLNKLIVSILVLVSMYGCSSTKSVTTTETKTETAAIVKDSTVVKDTIVSIPEEVAEDSITLIPVDSVPTKVQDVAPKTIKSGRASVTTKIKNNIVYVKANCDSVAAALKAYYIEHYRSVVASRDGTTVSSEVTEKIVYKVPKIVKIFAGIGILTSLLVIVKIYKWLTG